MFPDAFSSRQAQQSSSAQSSAQSSVTVPFTNQTLVTVQHNLGRRPLVQCELNDGSVIEGDIQHVNLNRFVVEFDIQISGQVIYI
jgi:hypothetical protein